MSACASSSICVGTITSPHFIKRWDGCLRMAVCGWVYLFTCTCFLFSIFRSGAPSYLVCNLRLRLRSRDTSPFDLAVPSCRISLPAVVSLRCLLSIELIPNLNSRIWVSHLFQAGSFKSSAASRDRREETFLSSRLYFSFLILYFIFFLFFFLFYVYFVYLYYFTSILFISYYVTSFLFLLISFEFSVLTTYLVCMFLEGLP